MMKLAMAWAAREYSTCGTKALMGGCTNCAGKSGCETHKGGMLRTVADHMLRLYPTKSWGHMDDSEALASSVDVDDILALAEELSVALKGATVFRAGTEADTCDFIYILCQGREPSALQVQYGGASLPKEWSDDDEIREFYLRLAVSSVAPLAVVQQVAVTASKIDGVWAITEEFSPGVYDAPLLKRFQRLVAILPAYGLTHLDMGEISAPPEGFDDSNYQVQFEHSAHQVNYLFFREPSTMKSTRALISNS